MNTLSDSRRFLFVFVFRGELVPKVTLKAPSVQDLVTPDGRRVHSAEHVSC